MFWIISNHFLYLRCKIYSRRRFLPHYVLQYLSTVAAYGHSELEGSGEGCEMGGWKDSGWGRKVVLCWWDFYDVLCRWSMEQEEEGWGPREKRVSGTSGRIRSSVSTWWVQRQQTCLWLCAGVCTRVCVCVRALSLYANLQFWDMQSKTFC